MHPFLPLRNKQPRNVTTMLPVTCHGQNLGQGSSTPRGEGWAHSCSRAQLDAWPGLEHLGVASARPGMAQVVWVPSSSRDQRLSQLTRHVRPLLILEPERRETRQAFLHVARRSPAQSDLWGRPPQLGCLHTWCQAGAGCCPTGHAFCSTHQHARALHLEAGSGWRASSCRRWAKATGLT